MAQFNLPTIDPAVATGTNLADWLNQWKPAMLGLQSGVAAPSYAIAGTFWLDTSLSGPPDNASFLKCFNGSTWVTLGSLSTSSATWTPAVSGNPALNNAGRNLLHNSMFNIAQRAGPFTLSGFTLDRWNLAVTTDAASVTRATLSDTDRAQIGDEAAAVCFSNAFTGNAAAGAYHLVAQAIEGARRLSGKTVTLSFWAKASSGLKLGINGMQSFGTGGSPSAAAWMLPTGLSVTLATSFARYSVSFTVPSTAGKTFGTNLDDFTTIALWFSSGATFATLGGNVGVQSGTISIWGVQLEAGPTATPLEKPDPVMQMQQCQRFYWVGQIYLAGYGAAGNALAASHSYSTPMRANPMLTLASNGSTNLGSITSGVLTGGVYYQGAITAAGNATLNITFTASAEL